jgi:hypothetical protein
MTDMSRPGIEPIAVGGEHSIKKRHSNNLLIPTCYSEPLHMSLQQDYSGNMETFNKTIL